MILIDVLSVLLVIAGGGFFMAGTLGLLRFPDVYCRLHALTKADNVGLGLIVAGLVLQVETWSAAGQLILIWLLVMFASSVAGYLVAHTALRRGLKPWTR